jgi:hypothetical protein
MDNVIPDRNGGAVLSEGSDGWNLTPENGLASEDQQTLNENAVITDPLTLEGKWIGLVSRITR